MRAALAVAVLVGGCDLVYSLDRPPTTGWAQVAVGYSHACGLTREDELYCWGSNTLGEVGIGDNLSTVDLPTRVGGTWSAISGQYMHVCGMQADGSAWCWGNNANGQLGNGSTTNTQIPKPFDGAWKRLSAGYLGSCALDVDDKLWCWGNNATAQLGDGTLTNQTSPVQIGDARWLDVAMGGLHTCGVQEDGTLWCWGDDVSQMPTTVLEDPALAMPSVVPVQLGTDTWRAIAALVNASCGITTGGRLRCWGSNRYRSIGIGDAARADAPTPVLVDGEDADDWVQIEGGVWAACAVRANGEAWCWGQNYRGELTGEETIVEVPRRVENPDGAKWTGVSIGAGNACFVDDRARLWCTGSNSFSQLGDGGTSPRTPSPPAPDAPATMVSAGDHVTCTIDNGELACGGKGSSLQLGTDLELPMRELSTIAGTWESVSIGIEHACGIQTGGAAYCWGTDRADALGNGAGTVRSGIPSAVMTARSFVSIDAGAYFTCGIDTAREMACWGDNFNGQVGNNTPNNSAVPTTVVGSSTMMMWISVSAGSSHACGILVNGTIRCWGANQFGQLGDGTTTDKRVATATIVPASGSTLPVFVEVSAGADHTCAIGVDDSLWCWGNNRRGQLGFETGFASGTSRATKLPEAWTHVAAGGSFTCAIRADTTMWCWGANTRGQLGDGSLLDRLAPVQLPGTGWTAVTAGSDHACALRGTNVLCWGSNDEGATLTGDAWTTELHEIVEPEP